MRRRTLIVGLACSGIARATTVVAPAASGDGLWVGTQGTPPHLARRVALRAPHVFSRSNDNRAWTVWVETDPIRRAGAWLFLRRGDVVVAASSMGGDEGRSTATFQVDRSTAESTADWLGAPSHPRTPLGQDLAVRFEGVEGSTVRMVIRNAGAPVGVIAGGRQRGPRNNRFHFEVWRDGERLDELDGWDFGGLSGVHLLEPGGELVQEADVALWADVSAAGRYVVRCRYEAELVPGTEFVRWPQTAHETWEPVYTGEVALQITSR